MPLKSKSNRTHHVAHRKERRTKRFLKVYAPYIPLLVIVLSGLWLSAHQELRDIRGSVASYATDMSDSGLLEATNSRRSAEGLAPLKFNNQLDTAAQSKAKDMAQKNYWSHNTPDGREPWVFIEGVQYKYRKAAENLAYGFTTSPATVNGWMNSPGHRANIMDPELREVGFGVIDIPDYQGKGPQTLVVAMYGQPAVLDDSIQLPVKSDASPVAAQKPQKISIIQSLTAGKAPWSTFIIGVVTGGVVMYLTVKHARVLRRSLITSERFVIHHPLFDVTLVALLILAFIAGQNIGNIY